MLYLSSLYQACSIRQWARTLVISNLRLETKGFRFESSH